MAWQGYVGNPQSAVEELAIFVTYFFNDSEQTHLLEAGPQSLGTRVVLQPVQRRCAGSCSLEGLEGVSAPPQGPHHRACRRPGRSPRPDRKELHSRCSSSGNWWATITYIHTREGFVYPATVTGLLLEKNCWLRHGGTHANRIGPKRSAKLTARNCQPIKGVTIFHVESRDRSTRPLTTPPP